MKLRYLIPFIFAGLTLTSCNLFNGGNAYNTKVASISLSETNLSLNPGESKTLTATVTTNDDSVSATVTWSSSNTSVVSISGTGKTKTFTVKSTAAGGAYTVITAALKADPSIKTTCKVTVNKINPTAITLDSSSLEICVGMSRSLTVTYTPSNANANKDVTWTSSNTSVATVSAGKVTVKSDANPGDTATITAKLTNLPSITASCNVTVSAQTGNFYTVLIYMCGANLESDYANNMDTDDDGEIDWYGWGLATMDIMEILKVPNKPDDVNIVIETGGAKEWTNNTNSTYPQYSANYSNGYNISSDKLQRHHVNSNGKIELDESLDTYTSMGSSSTLQSFLEYGLNNYPAQNTALILWNHGGGLQGVCFDEKKNKDGLTANEVASAVSGALNNTGHSGEKLEWIGYDACLMAVQDIADVNSQYFNYMVASEQTESGEGWAYEGWVDDLYAHKTTPQILTAICDEFVDSNNYYYDYYGNEHYNANYSGNDQTLAYYDLSKMDTYRTAWENMAAQLKNKLSSSNKNSFNTLIGNCQNYGDESAYAYGLVDAKDFLNRLSSSSGSFKPDSSYITAVSNAFSQLVVHSAKGAGAGNSNGLCLYWTIDSYTSYYNTYNNSTTRFTNWCYLVNNFGR